MKKLFSKSKSSKSASRSKSEADKPGSVLNAIAHNIQPSLPPKLTVPPVPYPRPFDRLLVQCTPTGLTIRPDIPEPESAVQITWGKEGRVQQLSKEDVTADPANTAVVYGIVGIVRLFKDAYLLVIADRASLGSFLTSRQPVFGVTGVSAIALEFGAATKAIATIKRRYKAISQGLTTATSLSTLDTPSRPSDKYSSSISIHVKFSPSTDERHVTPHNRNDSVDAGISDHSGATTPTSSSAVSGAAFAKTLSARLSFWNNKQTADDLKPLSAVLNQDTEPREVINSFIASAPLNIDQRQSELDDKIVGEIVKQYSRGIYFAYDFDLSTSVERKIEIRERTQKEQDLLVDLQVQSPQSTLGLDFICEANSMIPLWRRVERRFWWNEHLLKDFIEAGLHSYVLPLFQGHWQVVQFKVPLPQASTTDDELPPDESLGESSVIADYYVISRRSRERAGLRYQRRGADDEANVANFVETEAVMTVERENQTNIFSFVQIRGSIPLYWTQSGYNLKPAPQLSPEKSHTQNLSIMKDHIGKSINRYGFHTIINLAEQHGKEAPLTNAYKDTVAEWASPAVQYCGYDFHAETKGMRYENLAKLVDEMGPTFEAQGYTWVSDSVMLSKQKGVFRVNCIDCLDRTNVVQSAFARRVLQRQLNALALSISDKIMLTDMTVAFNDVWANNGDAISRAYAGTSALKGDFTRTGKRDLGGMLNDGMNSLARMYTSTFSDWFSQSVIDFMLGYRNTAVFSEFLHKLSSTDPSEMLRLSKIRAAAIETCVSRVLSEREQFHYGWTLLSPSDVNTKLGHGLEEKVLLLSSKALYIVSYDYHLEEVQMFTRVPVGDICSLQKGAYILSALEEGSRDIDQNFGFMVTFLSHSQTTRISSYSLRNSVDDIAKSMPPTPSSSRSFDISNPLERQDTVALSDILSNVASISGGNVTFAAFKALPVDESAQYVRLGVAADEPEKFKVNTCRQAVDFIVECILCACDDVKNSVRSSVLEEDIVSIAEAQRNASLYSKVEYGVKRLLWLGR